MHPRTLIALVLVVAACGGEVGETTTSAPPTRTTSLATTTSTAPTTTTTVPPTTTTTAATTTTTAPSGNWAEAPLVVSQFGALGWWDGANWFQVDETSELPVDGGEDYQVVLLGSDDMVTGSPEIVMCEPVFNIGVEIDDTEALGEPWPGITGVAISAPWELVPHFLEVDTDDDGTYSDLARPLLAARGLDVAEPVIKQVIRFDMEGDGINEILVVAEDISSASLFAEAGDYSLVFLRKVVEGEAATAVLGYSVVTEVVPGEIPFILSYAVAAVADLSNDSKMEIVLHETYYEGVGWTVWEYVNDDLGPVRQIGSGCGV